MEDAQFLGNATSRPITGSAKVGANESTPLELVAESYIEQFLPPRLKGLKKILSMFMVGSRLFERYISSVDIGTSDPGLSPNFRVIADAYAAYNDFFEATDIVDQNFFISISIVAGGWNNIHILQTLAEHLLLQTLNEEAAYAIIRCRQTQYVSMRTTRNHESAMQYAMILRKEASILAVQRSGEAAALSAMCMYHALNVADPVYEMFSHLATLIDGTLIIPSELSDGRVRLLDLLSLATGLELSSRVSTNEERICVTDEHAVTKVTNAKVFNDSRILYPEHCVQSENYVCVLTNAIVYSEYFKCGVMHPVDTLVRDLSVGPAEFYILTQKIAAPLRRVVLKGTTAFVAARHGWMEYYHWLICIVPRFGSLLKTARSIDHVIAFGAEQRSYCQEFFEILDLKSSIHGSAEEVSFETETLLITRENAHLSAEGAEFIRSVFIPERSPIEQYRMLYISRRNAKSRRVVDEEALIEVVESMGFKVLILEELTVRAQAKYFDEALIVVAPHGAGLSNVVFCRPGAKVLELIADGNPACYHILSSLCLLEYYALQCELIDNDINVDRLAFAKAVRSLCNKSNADVSSTLKSRLS